MRKDKMYRKQNGEWNYYLTRIDIASCRNNIENNFSQITRQKN